MYLRLFANAAGTEHQVEVMFDLGTTSSSRPTTRGASLLKDYAAVAWLRFGSKADSMTATFKLTLPHTAAAAATGGSNSSISGIRVLTAEAHFRVLPGIADSIQPAEGEQATRQKFTAWPAQTSAIPA